MATEEWKRSRNKEKPPIETDKEEEKQQEKNRIRGKKNGEKLLLVWTAKAIKKIESKL